MASITVRNLDDGLKRRLRIRAAENGRSMEQEAREILKHALEEEAVPVRNLGTAPFTPCFSTTRRRGSWRYPQGSRCANLQGSTELAAMIRSRYQRSLGVDAAPPRRPGFVDWVAATTVPSTLYISTAIS